MNSTGFFAGKFLPELVLVLGLVLPVGQDCAGNEFCGGGLCGNGSPSIMTHTNSTSSCLYGLLFLFMVGGLLLLFMETMIALLLQGFGSDYSGTLNEHL